MEDTKEQIIEKIQAIVKQYGSFSPTEVGGQFINLFPDSTSTLKVEFISEDDVTVGHYLGDTRIDDDCKEFHELSDEVLAEILELAESHEIACSKTMDRCKDENF